MRPTQITAARVQAIIDEWIAILGGSHDPLAIVDFHNAIATAGSWTLDADTSLWMAAGAGAAVLVLPFDFEATLVDAQVNGFDALVYVTSVAAAAQPTAELVIVDTSGATVATGSTITAAADIGWQVLTWSGGTPAAIGTDKIALLRITSGAAADRFAGAAIVLESP